ncbi:MAG: hypothetical protein Q8Q32_02420 [bacterium]|nr:hypothetical protein [bacterium]
MRGLFNSKNKYIEELKRRSKGSGVHHNHQFIGLEIATLLKDYKHKSLYIKMAKEYDSSELLAIAKDVAGRADVENPGAYFMSITRTLKKKGSGNNKS